MKLGEVIELYISGDWGNGEFSEETSNIVSCIRGADIVPISKNQFDNIPQRYVSCKTIKNKLLREGDLIIEKSGGSPVQSTGRITYVSKELIEAKGNVVCSNFCTAIRIKENWNSQYIYYYWTYIYNLGVFFNFEGKTSGIKNLQLESALSSIEIKEISINEQKRIVAILSSIENKAKINRAINHNLEAITKQLYDYWFVQFDFPDTYGRPYKSSGGKMVYNDKLKREIPEKWTKGVLSDIANISMGQSPNGNSYNDEGEGIIFYQGSTDFGIRFPQIRQYTTQPSRFASKGDILMSVRAPVGAMNIANNNCCIGRGLSALNSKIGSTTHLYYILDGLRIAFEQRNVAGTTFGSITKDDLYSLPIIVPQQSIIDTYERICKPIFNKQMEIGIEIDSLTFIRDALLPLLMNGQVSINYDL